MGAVVFRNYLLEILKCGSSVHGVFHFVGYQRGSMLPIKRNDQGLPDTRDFPTAGVKNLW